MSDLPNPNQMVTNSRIYGGGINLGALYGTMKNACSGNVTRWYAIRRSVEPLLSTSENRDIDSIYKGDNPFGKSIPATPGYSSPTLVAPISTTPTNSAGLIFPHPDMPKAERDAWYRSAAYQTWVAQHMAETAGPGFDALLDRYTLNGVLSYEANNNISGAMTYLQTIQASQSAQLAQTAKSNLSIKGYDVSLDEARFIMGGGTLYMVPDGTGKMISLDRFLDPNLITVVAPPRAMPPQNLSTVGILAMLSSGISYIPSLLGQSGSHATDYNRGMLGSELDKLSTAFAGKVDLSKVSIKFGTAWSVVADIAFYNKHPAVTIGNTIYVAGPPRDMSLNYGDISLLAHELEHVRQYNVDGLYTTLGVLGLQWANIAKPYDYQLRNTNFFGETLEGRAQMVGEYVGYKSFATIPSVPVAVLEAKLQGTGYYGL